MKKFLAALIFSCVALADSPPPKPTATFGVSVTSPVYKSASSNPASAGVLRLANTDYIKWRNADNSGDINLTVDGSNIFQFTGAINSSSTITATNFSGTNTGDVSLTGFGSTPSDGGASLSVQALTIQPADNTHPGSISLSAQTMGSGAKTFDTSVVSPIFKSATANPANAGVIRLANTELVEWRNFLNDGNVTLKVDASNIMQISSALTVAGDITGNLVGNVTGNASTSTALSTNKAACSSDRYTTDMDADGTLTCAQVTDAGLAVSYLKADGSRGLSADWNAGSHVITATTFTGALSGNATTATSSTTATNAVNVGITDDTTTNATMYPSWVTAATGNLPAKVSSTKLSFNPSTGTLTSTAFSGPLTGAVTGNVTGTASGNLAASPSNHGMLISSGTNTVTVLPPDASTTKVWTSAGSGADPSWQPPAASGTTYTANQYGVAYSSATNTTLTILAPDASTTKFLKSAGTGAAPAWSAVTLTTDVTGVLPAANGGDNSPDDIINCSIGATVAANAITFTLLDGAGSALSATSPCIISFRNATSATGTYTQVTTTAAVTLVGANGDSFGCPTASTQCILSLYAINNAGTVVLGITTNPLDEGSVQTSVALTGGADTSVALWSTAVQSAKAVKLLDRVTVTPGGAFAWNAAPTEISPKSTPISLTLGINGRFVSTGWGSLTMGQGAQTGIVQSTGIGSIACGKADSGASSSKINASGTGSIACGWMFGNTNGIRASAEGSLAMGKADNHSEITASGAGSHAHGTTNSTSSNIVASGPGSSAWGQTGSGIAITASGAGTEASGNMASGAITASGSASYARGDDSNTTGDYASSFGVGHRAASYASFVIGRYASSAGTVGSWVTTDPAFVIGNGANVAGAANAFLVLKDGTTTINQSTGTGVKSTLTLYNSSTATNNNAAAIVFQNNRTTGGVTSIAQVAGMLTDVTNGSADGDLVFYTMFNGVAADEKLRINNVGHVVTKGTAPTITANCGTTPSVAGTDIAGRITVGTGGVDTACTLTFANAWAVAPSCHVQDETTITGFTAVASTTTLIITAGGAITASDKITYTCWGY